MACLDHAEEGTWEPVDLIDEPRDERSKLGMIRDSACPPSCGARHEGSWAKNPIMQIGLHRRRCQIARHQMAAESCEEACIRVRGRGGYYTHNLSSVQGHRFCV